MDFCLHILCKQNDRIKSTYCVKLFLICHQDQASRIQAQLNEEELKNSKLLQEIAKLEEQVAVITQETDHKDEVEIFNLHEKLENVL